MTNMNSPMKIVIADPPDVATQWLIANHPNLGALYLIGYLRDKISGVEMHYLDAHLNLRKIYLINSLTGRVPLADPVPI